MQIESNGLTLEVARHGTQGATPVLMIMGLGQQLTAWPPALLDALAAHDLAPIVFDNRDVGLSSKFDAWGVPNLIKVMLQHALRLPIRAPYLLADMARDALGVLDALGIARAHVVGISMGGMIAQLLAASVPERVDTVTLIMTTSGARGLPGPAPAARKALLARPKARNIEALVDHGVGVWRVIGSPAYPPSDAELRVKVEQSIRRAFHPQGVARQIVAITASGDRTRLLRDIKRPTLVIHGRDDPLVPVACGMDLAKKIPRARLEVIEGMGHDLPLALMPSLAQMIAAHGRAA